MSDKFTCAVCGGTFAKNWTDEEAMAEKEKNWGDLPLEECDVTCDDCYKKFMAYINSITGHA